MNINPVRFRASCLKTLTAVEASPERSNQHEFNGVKELQNIFGLTGFKRDAVFSIRGENIQSNSEITWYDAREAHPTRTEYRLYFRSNPVMARAKEGDNIVIGFDSNDQLHCVLIKTGTHGHLDSVTSWRNE